MNADTIEPLLAGIADAGAAARLLRDSLAAVQHPGFFMLALEKERRRKRLQARFGGQRLNRVLLSYGLRHLLAHTAGLTVEALPADYFSVENDDALAAKVAHLAGAVVISENNDAGFHAAGFARLSAACGETLFAIWDQDNHHWLQNSANLAAHCDLYVPAHNDNLYALSRFNSSTGTPVPCAVIQWPRRFIEDHVATLLSQPRSNEPLGRHAMYGPFTYRNQVIATLNKSLPSVCFVDGRQFRGRTPQDRLIEWASHKAHWIVPTLNDIPQRLFDALATGGIPIVPEALRHATPISTLDPEHIVFYGAHDIVDPTRVVAEALTKFDRRGTGGVIARHRCGVEQHHGDQRAAVILQRVAREYGMEISA